MKRERNSQPSEKLTFYSSPALHDSTWTRGFMDIVAEYGGEPFAYMVVTDGVWDDTEVFRNAECSLYEKTGHHAEYVLRRLLRPLIVAGCKEVIMNECPAAVILSFTQQGAPAVKGLDQG